MSRAAAARSASLPVLGQRPPGKPQAQFPDETARRFACERCGNCCRRPGVVHFTPGDVARAARFLELSPREFRRQYLMKEDGDWILEGRPDEGCIFFDDAAKACLIHEAKPMQCRAWPFWPEVMKGRAAWRRAARHCPGMGKGPAREPAEVERWLAAMRRLPGGEGG